MITASSLPPVRRCLSAGLGTLLLCLGVCRGAGATTDLYVTGLSEIHENGRKEGHSYWVDWANLPPKASWRPEAEELPLELDKEVQRAKLFVAQSKHLADVLDLTSLTIRRLAVSERQLEAHQKVATQFTNQWFLTFEFRARRPEEGPESPLRFEHVVMLLDGTYATERAPRNWPHGSTSVDASRDLSGDSTSHRPALTGKADLSRHDPGAALHSPDLPVPRIQWDTASPFPVSFLQQTRALTQHLVARLGASGGSFLDEIVLNRFTPTGAVQREGLPPSSHRNHWVLLYYFNEPCSRANPAYEVVALLDGTVVDFVESPLSQGPASHRGIDQ